VVILEEKIYFLFKNNLLTTNELSKKIKTKQENIVFVARKLLDKNKISKILIKIAIKEA
jgi:hypothetical protein